MTLTFIDQLALVAAILLPLFNIPLVIKIIHRKSSRDLSLIWVMGVWICIVLMAPSAFRSQDVVWRTFSYINVSLFTCVMIVAVKYRKGPLG